MVYVYIRPHTSHTYIYIRPRRTPHVFLLVQRYRAAGAICGPVLVPFRKQNTTRDVFRVIPTRRSESRLLQLHLHGPQSATGGWLFLGDDG